MPTRNYFVVERQQPIYIHNRSNKRILLSSLWRTVAVVEKKDDADAILTTLSAKKPSMMFRIERKRRARAA